MNDLQQQGTVTSTSLLPADVNDRFWGTLQMQPQEPVFDNLETDEQVLFVVGRHPITRLGLIASGVVLALLPVVVVPVGLLVISTAYSWLYFFVGAWLWYGMVVFYFISTWLAWRTDVYVVTNERILDFDANALTFKQVRDVDLSTIQTVSAAETGGLIKGGVDYGDVSIVILGVEEPLVMRDVPMPGKISLMLGELVEQARRNTQPTPGTAPAPNQEEA